MRRQGHKVKFVDNLDTEKKTLEKSGHEPNSEGYFN
jgi:hypothetical protein